LELHVRDFARWLAQRDDVSLSLGLRAGSYLDEDLSGLAVPVLRLRGRGGILSWAKVVELARFIKIQHIDVVHVHWKYDLPLVALARRFSRHTFTVAHTRHMDLPGAKRDPYHRFVYGSIDLLITITRHLQRQARERLPLPPGKIEQIYPGSRAVATASEHELRSLKQELRAGNQFTVGVVGRLLPYKGQHLLIEAVRQLRDDGLVVHALIVGEPETDAYLEQLQRTVREHHLDGQIRFLGFQAEPHNVIQCLDALVLTTRKETFGLVLVEAMLLGVPVIGTDAGGVPEIITHEQTGLLFAADDAGSLAACIRRLAGDAQLREWLATAGRTRAREEFWQETQFAKTLAALKRIAPD
jgi:glycosyltransferase involved in cell wall biosynthesis